MTVRAFLYCLAALSILSATWDLSPLLAFLVLYLGVGLAAAIRIGDRGLNEVACRK
jgi:hypothetical protein